MQQENIRRVLVWSVWLRLSHWVIAGGVLFQFVSAWAIEHDEAGATYWLDWHIITGQVILIALAMRVTLLFFPGSGNWRAFIPEKAQVQAMVQMIKFYLSFARFPLPSWYAHNPLWLPIYPVLYIILAGCSVSGLLYNSAHVFFSSPMFELHAALAGLIATFTVFHIATVFLHDLKGKGAFISAMVNGFRYFHYSSFKDDEGHNSQSGQSGRQSVSISVDSIKKQGADK
jgi:Ni/Fe-hydrogenase 1 B-type cytochrome subunit